MFPLHGQAAAFKVLDQYPAEGPADDSFLFF